jgi:tetratricopeptide (TPR) repeat protein
MVFSLLLLLAMQPDPAAIRRLFEENLARQEKLYGADDKNGKDDGRIAEAARDLGLFLKRQGDRAGAQAALARAVQADENTHGKAAPQTLADAAELAALSPAEQAEPLWRRIANTPDPGLASRALAALGDLRAAAQDTAGAVSLYRRALAKEEEAQGKNSAGVAVRLNALAVLVEPKEGVPMLQRALAIDRRLLGERHPETSTTEANLAGFLLDSGRADAALRLANAALAGLEDTLGPENPRVASVSTILAFCWRAKGDRVRAERLYRRALAIDEGAYGAEHPETLNDVKNLAEFLREIGKTAEAAALEKRTTGKRLPR